MAEKLQDEYNRLLRSTTFYAAARSRALRLLVEDVAPALIRDLRTMTPASLTNCLQELGSSAIRGLVMGKESAEEMKAVIKFMSVKNEGVLSLSLLGGGKSAELVQQHVVALFIEKH